MDPQIGIANNLRPEDAVPDILFLSEDLPFLSFEDACNRGVIEVIKHLIWCDFSTLASIRNDLSHFNGFLTELSMGKFMDLYEEQKYAKFGSVDPNIKVQRRFQTEMKAYSDYFRWCYSHYADKIYKSAKDEAASCFAQGMEEFIRHLIVTDIPALECLWLESGQVETLEDLQIHWEDWVKIKEKLQACMCKSATKEYKPVSSPFDTILSNYIVQSGLAASISRQMKAEEADEKKGLGDVLLLARARPFLSVVSLPVLKKMEYFTRTVTGRSLSFVSEPVMHYLLEHSYAIPLKPVEEWYCGVKDIVRLNIRKTNHFVFLFSFTDSVRPVVDLDVRQELIVGRKDARRIFLESLSYVTLRKMRREANVKGIFVRLDDIEMRRLRKIHAQCVVEPYSPTDVGQLAGYWQGNDRELESYQAWQTPLFQILEYDDLVDGVQKITDFITLLEPVVKEFELPYRTDKVTRTYHSRTLIWNEMWPFFPKQYHHFRVMPDFLWKMCAKWLDSVE